MKHLHNPKRILVYIGPHRDDAIGENLIKLPFLRAIRSLFPTAEITWCQGHDTLKFQTILEPLNQNLIDGVLPDTALGHGWGAALNPFRLLPGQHYDLIIDTQKSAKRTMILRRLSHTVFISSAWRFFFSSLKPDTGKLRSGTLTERLIQLLEIATGEPINVDHKAILPSPFTEAAKKSLPDGPAYIGLAPGAGRITTGKCWPLAHYIKVAQHQLDKGRTPVFFLGPDEVDWKDQITPHIPNALFSTLDCELDDGTLVNGPTLTIALGARIAVGVANCSGTGHMLAAGGAPMVSLFGPTSPKKFAPFTPDISILRAQDFGGSTIDLIPVQAVNAAIDERINESPTQE